MVKTERFYLLRSRHEELPHNKEENPWVPWYDKTFGFVIKATSEKKARKIAQERSGDETGIWGFNDNEVWTDPDLVSCIPLEQYNGDPVVIYRDKRA